VPMAALPATVAPTSSGTAAPIGSLTVDRASATVGTSIATARALNISDPPDGTAVPMADGFRSVNAPPIFRVVPTTGAAAVAMVAMTALVPGPNRQDAAPLGGSTNGSGLPKPFPIQAAETATAEEPPRPVPVGARSAALRGTLVDTVIE